jgi:NADPH:quinone reductase-like Zn-dependent oxidoreductase
VNSFDSSTIYREYVFVKNAGFNRTSRRVLCRRARGTTKEAEMKAVRFAAYGDVDVLDVVEVPDPVPGAGEVLVRVTAAGINPGEATIRNGLLADRWPATFPSGQGSDLAGIVERAGAGVDGRRAGDEVIGFTNDRASQAELVVVGAENLTPRPSTVPWDAAGALFVAGATAWAAARAVGAAPGDTILVSGAAGGVGTIAVQLARNAGARVIGLASEPHHGWLREHGVVPVTYGDGVAERIREAADGGVDALIDTFGSGYVDLAIALGVAPERIDTIIDYDAAARHGAKTDASAVGTSAAVLAELAQLIAEGRLEIPIAGVYPLDRVRDAYLELEQRHTLGKIVLHP